MRNHHSGKRGHRLTSWLESTALGRLALRLGAAGPADRGQAPAAGRADNQRLLRGLGEALERIAAREAEEAAARSHASS